MDNVERVIQAGMSVIFKEISDEVYSYQIPKGVGTVRLVTQNITLLQTLGVEIPMCLVDFPEGAFIAYSDDLQVIDNNEEVRSRIDVN